MIGVPWVRWCANWDACDCYGLVIMYYRHVLGIELGEVPRADIVSGFAGITGWEECGPEPGVTGFMAWRNGAPEHCGVLLPRGMLLHAQGSPERGGSVRLTSLVAMRRLYSDITFYRRAC